MRELAERRKDFKKGLDSDACRRGRTETSVRIRKDKKTDSLAKRRNMTLAIADNPTITGSGDSMNDASGVKHVKRVYTVEDIPYLMTTLRNSNGSMDLALEAVQGFRRMLSIADNPPVQPILDCGALPIFVQLLQCADDRIKFEAAWALTNVASSDYTPAVVDVGAVPSLVELLMCANSDVREQSAWCLGNIAGDSPTLRDYLLQAWALGPLLKNITQPATKSLLGNCVWTLSNFCRGKPQVDLDLIRPAIPVLAELLISSEDEGDVLIDVCWALSYLSDGDENRIQAVIDAGVTVPLINFLSGDDIRKITPALRTLGNFVSGSDVQTQSVVDGGALKSLVTTLDSSKKNIRKESCWLLSNIAAGNHNQINTLVSNHEIMKRVISAATSAEWEVRKEAAWVCSNIATGGLDIHAEILVHHGGLKALCGMLESSDTKIILVVLEAIEKILQMGEKLGHPYPAHIDEYGGLEQIEKLQEHENEEIYNKCVEMIETYFEGEEVDNENIAPSIQDNGFKFGVPQAKNLEKQLDAASETNPQKFNFSF